jgi:hypothetical protein
MGPRRAVIAGVKPAAHPSRAVLSPLQPQGTYVDRALRSPCRPGAPDLGTLGTFGPRQTALQAPLWRPPGAAGKPEAPQAPDPGQALRAQFVWQRRFLRRPTLLALEPSRRIKDTSTIVMFELDNFGDIGATPLFATPLSPLGLGIIPLGGLACLVFGTRPALQDVTAGLRNLRALRGEKEQIQARLQLVRAALNGDGMPPELQNSSRLALRREWLTLQSRLAICANETRTERVDRVISGALVAPGSVLTGLGTFVSPGFIFSANSASAATVANLCTGFVGNAPIALYSVVNAAYNARNAYHAHQRLLRLRQVTLNPLWNHPFINIDGMLQHRQRLMRNNSACKAISALGIGTGGLLTAFNPVGYAVLLPFAIGRASAEYVAHRKLGYSRRTFAGETAAQSLHLLSSDLIYATQTYCLLKNIKRSVRRRYPWGIGAPVPFNWCRLAVAKLQSLRRVPQESPLQSLYKMLCAYQQIEANRLVRLGQTLAHDRRRAQRCPGSPGAAQQTRKVLLQLQATRAQAARVAALGRTLQQHRVDSRATPQPHLWISLVVHFFAELRLFPLLAAALYKDPVVNRILRATTHGDERVAHSTFCIDGEAFLRSLGSPQRALLADPKFLSSFYLCAERVLLTDVKQHMQELRRELMDSLTARVWLHGRPVL